MKCVIEFLEIMMDFNKIFLGVYKGMCYIILHIKFKNERDVYEKRNFFH